MTSLTDRELGTVLAALRNWQAGIIRNGPDFAKHPITTNDEEFEPLLDAVFPCKGALIMKPFHTEDIESNGRIYRVEHHYDDDDCGAPWDNEDGHGPVETAEIDRTTGYIRKRPGQVVLHHGDRNEYSYLYDFAEAMKIAKRDGWNAEPYDAPSKALRAVRADVAHLRGWLRGDWHYLGVVVTPLTPDGDELRSKSESLWGIASCAGDYLNEVARELITEIEP